MFELFVFHVFRVFRVFHVFHVFLECWNGSIRACQIITLTGVFEGDGDLSAGVFRRAAETRHLGLKSASCKAIAAMANVGLARAAREFGAPVQKRCHPNPDLV